MRSLLTLVPAIAIAASLAACERESDLKPPGGAKPGPAAKPSAASSAKVAEATMASTELQEELKKLKPLPKRMDIEKNPATEAKINLGRMLYYEPRLSKNHDISCNSCHDLSAYGVDGKPFSPGHKGQLGGRSSPTSYNAGNHVSQFWDGRAATLEDQAKGPILNPVEMAMPDEKKVLETLASIKEYVALFKEAFPGEQDPVTYDNLARAIGAFERGLVTPSRFDKYLTGDKNALTQEEQNGLAKFLTVGCQSCHDGEALGGTTYQKLGKMNAFAELKDFGRFDATKKDDDKFFFRVPSLRNIAKTGPYYHDGHIKTLEEAVDKMAWHQLNVKLKEGEMKSIVTFLNALTGDLPTDYIKKPELPKSGPKTPKPDPS
ncbi:cytochrome-c peroxidase [Chondromyces apiculatus]|uniref:Cytochrome c551 peroxidase n=1 Tax=Chondromyces apiculatus DSM 436 TaxID=1192034 RepID=A0A017TIZ9_9BACT|nr:cytochrome c peroxidase [Chondromyces apiculatus]EYF08825.1 Cytochrome c551 peroxidase [Chondromyces apiculatus DSM 436]